MKISASVYSYTDKEIGEVVNGLEQIGVDYFHIDCNDDLGVFQDLTTVRNLSSKPLDVHIITDRPEVYFKEIERVKPEFVCFQYEDLPAGFEFPVVPGVSFGLAIKTETAIDTFNAYADSCDFLLVMATTPGKSGGQFDPDNFRKIRSFMRRYPKKKVTVDGGVNGEVSFILRSYGVHTAVAGSYLAKSDKGAVSLNTLRHESVESHYLVKDMMVSRQHSPVLNIRKASIAQILQSNEQHRLGYVLLEDNENHLVGISTNADIRRALLKNINNFSKLSTEDLVNDSPLFIREEATIKEMFDLLRNSEQLISYLPVVDSEHRLTGAINLHFLIKGEL